jgi:tRNA(Arg) A34 adenosine deaminase TadA
VTEPRPPEDTVVGRAVPDLGGEEGLLRLAVDLAARQARDGEPPFAALVVTDGVVSGVGVNTVERDLDPAAHAEVAAVRDAARRLGSPDLPGALLYASCEPCAICRTVAQAAGVAELVYAAPKELLSAALGAVPAVTVQLIDAVGAVLPGFVRPGATGLPDAELARPFTEFAAARS